MKKLLTILGAVGLVATTGATVVACGNNPVQSSWKGDDISNQEIHWNLDSYNQKDEGTHQPKIWIQRDKLFNEQGDIQSTLTEKEWSQTIWTGILNYDDKEGGSALPEFESKQLWNVLHFTFAHNWEEFNGYLKEALVKDSNNKYYIEDKDSKVLGMKLDVDVLSFTNDGNGHPISYGLEKSEMHFMNGLIINIIDTEETN